MATQSFLLLCVLLLAIGQSAEAVPCTLSWDYPVAEPVTGFRLYRGVTVASLAPVEIVLMPMPHGATITAPFDCIAGEFLAVTAVNAEMVESEKSNIVQVIQALSPGNFRIVITVTVP